MRLLYFNPETEYALASGASFYTPPSAVCALRHACRLLPEKWALPGDFILVDSFDGLVSDFALVDWSMLNALFSSYPDILVDPWGWNPALLRKFLDAGVPASCLPAKSYVMRVRELAHRRTTIELNSRWNMLVSSADRVGIPRELFAVDECMDFVARNRGCWLKAPWSSSGRGVINTAADMEDVQIGQWCSGIIRRQGSVMAETAADKIADFATEWMIGIDGASYLGLSSFNTSNRGKYLSNDVSPQSVLVGKFDRICRIPLRKVISLQKVILESVLAGYSGPVGVDMIVCSDTSLRPFVEVNLRRTMGMLAIS